MSSMKTLNFVNSQNLEHLQWHACNIVQLKLDMDDNDMEQGALATNRD